MKKTLRLCLVLVTVVLIVLFEQSKSVSVNLPVLMYHHFDMTESAYTVVSEPVFREQMEALNEAGYQTVTLQDIYSFVYEKEPLPEKPVLITMDDGYTSNLEIAAPILEELDMCATVFVIGINEGEPNYVHSGEPFDLPRFSYEEVLPWVEKGVIDVQCHTYDLHQLASYGYSGRDGMLIMEGEAAEEYYSVIKEDFRLFHQRRSDVTQTEMIGLAYPFGYHTQELDDFLKDEVAITLTTNEHVNTLERNNPDSLRKLGRFNIWDKYTGDILVEMLDDLLVR